MYFLRFVLIPLLLVASACSKSEPPIAGMKVGKPYSVDGRTYYPSHEPKYDKVGDASWYGPGFHGKYTASGEVFNQNDMTAAHPTLPMPSLVRVTNLSSGKSTVVRINDRGPFARNRIIDLSKKSAQTIGMLSVGKVRVQYLPQETQDYIAQVKATGKKNISMASYNDFKTIADDEQIVASNEETTRAGQTINDAAPIQSVSSESLGGSVQSNDLPEFGEKEDDNKQLAYNPPKSEKRLFRDETGKPVVLKGARDSSDDVAAGPRSFNPVRGAEASEVNKKTASLNPAASGKILIQVGSFSSEENARKLEKKLSDIGRVDISKIAASSKGLWRVRLGPFQSEADASSALAKVKAGGLSDAHIIH